jgi:hypothetical protein
MTDLQLLVRAGPDRAVQLGDRLPSADDGDSSQDTVAVCAAPLVQLIQRAHVLKRDRKQHVNVDTRRRVRLEHGEKLLDRFRL